MHKLFAAVSLIAVAAALPAGADNSEAKASAKQLTNCHAAYHAMALLAEKSKYDKDAAENAKAKKRFADADKKATELALKAYGEDGKNTAAADIDEAASQYEKSFDELTGERGAPITRAKLLDEIKICDDLLKDD